MSAIAKLTERFAGNDLEKALGLRPRYPGLALGMDSERLFLVRVKPGRQAVIEAVAEAEAEPDAIPCSIFQQSGVAVESVQRQVSDLLTRTGTKPGKASLILPDNLAKISLLQLPEKPGSTRALDQLVRAQVRRSVPFRLDEARLSYQMMPGGERGVVVLVVLLRQALVEQFERACEGAGLRLGLVDLTTPNRINLCRGKLDDWSARGDVAVLNSAPAYFSLAIVRAGRLIFFRCKSYPSQGLDEASSMLTRELASSLGYYRDKLDGAGIDTLAVRSVGASVEELTTRLSSIEVGNVVPILPDGFCELGEGVRIEPALAQRLTPALGAAMGRR